MSKLDLTSRLYVKAWVSEPVPVPRELLARGEWVGLAVVYNVGRCRSLAAYRVDLLGNLEAEIARLNAEIAACRVAADAGAIDQLPLLIAQTSAAHRRWVLRLASYLLSAVILPDGATIDVDEESLDIPELYPLLWWVTDPSTYAQFLGQTGPNGAPWPEQYQA